MAFDHLVGKAKDKAKEMGQKAAEKAHEVSEGAKTKAEELTEKTKETAEKAKDLSVEASGQISVASLDAYKKFQISAGTVTEWSKEKINTAITWGMGELNALKPLLLEAEFVIKRVEVGMSIPPRINVILGNRRDNISALDQVLKTHEGQLSKFQQAVLVAIQKTFHINHITVQYGYSLGDFEVSLTIPPEVTVELVETGATCQPPPRLEASNE